MSDITIYTLAEELNMTPSMISRAFNPECKVNEEKRKIILETAAKYNFVPNKFASRLSMKTIRIGVLINSRFEVNTDKMLQGIKCAYDELKDYKIEYDIEILNSDVNKMSDYSEALTRYLSHDGVIVSGLSADKYTDVLNSFYKSNKNLVQVHAINDGVECLFASKHDEATASYIAAEFLYNCLKTSKRKNVLLFTGDRESTIHAASYYAFEKAALEFGINIIGCVDMKDNIEYFTSIISACFDKYENETDGIYITSGMSRPLCEYIESNNIDTHFVGFDTHSDVKEYLKKGIISATIEQNVQSQMYAAFKNLVMYLVKNEKCSETVYTDIQLVLRSNMHQFK